jgi:hypothetical protein
MKHLRSKPLAILCILIVFLIGFIGVNIIHFQFFPVRVVLYDSLLDVLIVVALIGAWCLVARRRSAASVLTPWELGLTIALGAMGCVLYAITIPTVIDRSLSVYILEKLAQRGGEIRYDAFPAVLEKEFMQEHQIVDIRLTEQLNSGTISIANGCVRLTPRGERIAKITRFFRTHFLPKHRQIMGQFTDALTDPFRDSEKVVETDCPK